VHYSLYVVYYVNSLQTLKETLNTFTFKRIYKPRVLPFDILTVYA